eukprot:m.180767 g.180767  ORF g.180767 m.180767 type:complete len:210 (-) comp14655_c0_seq4:477-1106(-)
MASTTLLTTLVLAAFVAGAAAHGGMINQKEVSPLPEGVECADLEVSACFLYWKDCTANPHPGAVVYGKPTCRSLTCRDRVFETCQGECKFDTRINQCLGADEEPTCDEFSAQTHCEAAGCAFDTKRFACHNEDGFAACNTSYNSEDCNELPSCVWRESETSSGSGRCIDSLPKDGSVDLLCNLLSVDNCQAPCVVRDYGCDYLADPTTW